MRLTVIGCSGSMSGPRSSASSYLVQAQGVADGGGERTWSILLDLGPGSMGQLLRHLDPGELDAIVISHCHADHMVDLVGMHVYRRWSPAGALAPVPCIGPAETLTRLQGVDGTAASGETYATEFTFSTAIPHQPVTVGPFTITPFNALHPVEAYGFRVEGPSESGSGRASMAFTGDTDICEGIVEMADGVDLLLAEAAFVEGRDQLRGMHLTGRRAGELAAGGSAGRLVLTHIQPWTDPEVPVGEAREVFDGLVEAATSGATWAF